MEYENKFLRSLEDVDDFRKQVAKEGLFFDQSPWFVSKEVGSFGDFTFDEDVHVRSYARPDSKMGIMVIYYARLEWAELCRLVGRGS